MALRRNDARRRRMVIDPTVHMGGVAAKVADGTSATPPRRKKVAQPDARDYSYGADRRNQPKTTDLIPKRTVSYLLVVLALLTCLWLINFTSVRADQWSKQIGQAGMDMLAMRGPGSLASWFSSILLVLAGVASLQIYALRRHRCDDYVGKYRLWLWTAALLVIASINSVANLGAVATNLVQSMIGDSQTTRAWVPLAIKLTALAALMGRGTYEVRESRGSLWLVLSAWIAYSVTIVLQVPFIQTSMEGLGANIIIGNCMLFGTAALFLAHLTFGRYIFLHAHGLITQRDKKEKRTATRRASASKTLKKKKAATKKAETKKTAAKKSETKKAAAQKTETKRAAAAKKAETKKALTSKKKSSATSGNAVSDESTVAKQSGARKPNSRDASKAAAPRIIKKPSAPPASSNKSQSPSDVLKELAAASRAKEQSQSHSNDQSMYFDDDENEGVIRMSKAQRRKQRKLDKQRRRAA